MRHRAPGTQQPCRCSRCHLRVDGCCWVGLGLGAAWRDDRLPGWHVVVPVRRRWPCSRAPLPWSTGRLASWPECQPGIICLGAAPHCSQAVHTCWVAGRIGGAGPKHCWPEVGSAGEQRLVGEARKKGPEAP
ncbi:hypothetical protein NDU88_007443 [Pleurodeles waltl]|uniref:Uncharacterized protein n=1 Tax=Pleurodeles waltl TaxID=8319 RepID=A0AAV7VPS1_PLEWA|nr:hypothetical protein NDU88_007443 [Pleurodeles waltl]